MIKKQRLGNRLLPGLFSLRQRSESHTFSGMTTRARTLPHYTYDDYVQWEGRWEVIDGIPFAMSPSPSPRHQFLANEIGFFLKSQLLLEDCKCRVYQPIDLKIREDVILQPDLLIVCEEIRTPYLDHPPIFVAEILSPSTKLTDQNTKFDLYEEFGIHYYLMVDPESNQLQLFHLDDSKTYRLLSDMEIQLEDHCSISLKTLPALLFNT